jgi:myo-inositol-1(or 4)-monophosphatase
MQSIPEHKMKEFLSVAIRAAKNAGKLILNNLGRVSPEDIHTKQSSDFVTYVDRKAEEIIIKTIKDEYPEHLFLAEESFEKDDNIKGSYQWIIDPLDGTTNYIHQYPAFGVSIALLHNDEVIAGVILDPLRKELFTGEKGKGAFLNKARIHVSQISHLKDCLIATGFPFRKKEIIDLYLKLFKNIFHRVSDIRRAGSASLDLAHLACGRCDGFFEIGLKPWDIAAGSLIIKEAGGVVSDFSGSTNYLLTGNIVAGTPLVHAEILKEVKEVFKEIIDK